MKKRPWWMLAALVLAAVLFIPSLRTRVADRLGESERFQRWVDRGKEPVRRWTAGSEAEHLLRTLQDLNARGRPLPQARQFSRFARERLKEERGGRDPWGTAYMLEARRDSIIVISAGPDRTYGTPDDVRAGTHRN